MRPLVFLLALFMQAPQAAPLTAVRTTLQRLAGDLDQHKATYGATPDLTTAKHALRDWVESQLTDLGERVDTRALRITLHGALRAANLLCDDCDWNVLGYVDDVRVERTGEFLVLIMPAGISCGYDESAYVYSWDGRRWRRIWEHEQNTYTEQEYRPQMIHDVQISAPDANQDRTLMVLSSQTICGGAFKNLYARTWRMDTGYRATPVLNWTGYGNDGVPPLRGRVLPNDALFVYAADGIAAGDAHTAVRHFTIDGGAATQADPVAGTPHDFVLEWLDSQLQNNDHIGDFAQPTLKCTMGTDLWQVSTRLFEKPKRYYRVRWQRPFTFTMVDVSETPFPDCTIPDEQADADPDILTSSLR
jgi:hypothetical protein